MSDETETGTNEETLFEVESEQHLSVAAVARRLREVADGLEAGALQSGGHAVTPAATVKFEEEYSAETTDEGTTFELELELKWNSTPADGQADHANHGSKAAARAGSGWEVRVVQGRRRQVPISAEGRQRRDHRQ